ncbi:hypothetical protein GCM10023191_042480 [Actinoallomurus oryzae]|uniref:Lipoprotein n=1 Tax=Actinoallomurus oryzae TaxID=502180 RepID=A0ABP8Q7A4_9ACTN
MSYRSAVYLGGTLTVGALLAGCSGRSDGEHRFAPSPEPVSTTSEASAPSPTPSTPTPAPSASDPSGQAGIKGARLTLQAFLRGSAAADAAACRYVAENSVFARKAMHGDCRAEMRKMPHLLKPDERRALRSVTVSGGGLNEHGDATIPFSGLSWTKGNMTVYTLQPKFRLHRSGGMWKVVS